MTNHKCGSATEPAALMSVQEVAGFLGVGRTTTFQLLADGELISVKVRGSRRIRRSDLEAYVAGLGA